VDLHTVMHNNVRYVLDTIFLHHGICVLFFGLWSQSLGLVLGLETPESRFWFE